MKTETLTSALSKMTERGAKTRFAESHNITLSDLGKYAKRGYCVAYVNDKALLMNNVERNTLIKFEVIDG